MGLKLIIFMKGLINSFTSIFLVFGGTKVAVKVNNSSSHANVRYKNERWDLLANYRRRAIEMISAFQNCNLFAITHGSIARGDVTKNSDIDIFIPEIQNSFLVETALTKANINLNSRFLIQATPTYAMKAHIEVDESTTVSFPLMQMRRVEREFYQFGGEANLSQLKADIRVPGIDKRLMFIEPTEIGHIESSVIGKEEPTAKILGISTETILDRVHALTKRDTVGRTGVFVKRELSPDETFELALKRISEINPAVRRRMRKKV
jgi:uncharacterized protein